MNNLVWQSVTCRPVKRRSFCREESHAQLDRSDHQTLSRCSAGITPLQRSYEEIRLLSGHRLVVVAFFLAAVWNAAEATGYPYTAIVKLLILTAQRRSEVTGLRWTKIDAEQGLWSMPAERTKNGRAHQVPLLPMTKGIMSSLPKLNPTFAFPARGNDEPTFSGFSKMKRRLDELSGVAGWTLHDLRRTTATKLAGLGVAPHVVEKLLNHTAGTLGGFAGIYSQFQNVAEMREALARWEAHIVTLATIRTPTLAEA